MEILEKLRQFLLGFSGLEGELSVDFIREEPGCAVLLPVELEETARRTDLLGNMQVDYTYRFSLCRRMMPGQDSAQWVLDFQNWLLENRSRLPQFGDVAAVEQIQVKKSKNQESTKLGTGLCTITLAVCFRKDYKAKAGAV